MLKESQIHSFYDANAGFIVHFLEGQKLIHDLVLIHMSKAQGLRYLRDSVLSFQLLISFLKPGEGLGIYIDNEAPYLRFKIETNVEGNMRALLIPEDLQEFPSKLNGLCRLTKTFTQGKAPYTSVIDLHDLPCDQLANNILKDSYQMDGRIFLSDTSDQSILILKLPPINVDKVNIDGNQKSIQEYWFEIQKPLNLLFQSSSQEPEDIKEAFNQLGAQYLRSKTVQFKCACSKERMISGLVGLVRNGESLFSPPHDPEKIETKCDYCKKEYLITKDEIIREIETLRS